MIFLHTLISYLVPLQILMNNNGYCDLSFPTPLIEKLARMIGARTLQFSTAGDVLSP